DLIDSLPAADPWRHPDPDTFGTWRDGTDLMPPQVANVREDIGLAALARPLSPEAVQVITRASAGWSDLADHLETLDDLVVPATRAISRLAWRRTAYLGPGDFFPALSVFTWINIARDGIDVVPPADERPHDRSVHTARIVDPDYAPLWLLLAHGACVALALGRPARRPDLRRTSGVCPAGRNGEG